MAPRRPAKRRPATRAAQQGGLGRLVALLGLVVGAGGIGGALALLAVYPAGTFPVPPLLAAGASLAILGWSVVLVVRHARPDRSARRRRSGAAPKAARRRARRS
jgi:uncharacterized membrane protein SpoIIM required for sporulation